MGACVAKEAEKSTWQHLPDGEKTVHRTMSCCLWQLRVCVEPWHNCHSLTALHNYLVVHCQKASASFVGSRMDNIEVWERDEMHKK